MQHQAPSVRVYDTDQHSAAQRSKRNWGILALVLALLAVAAVVAYVALGIAVQ